MLQFNFIHINVFLISKYISENCIFWKVITLENHKRHVYKRKTGKA